MIFSEYAFKEMAINLLQSLRPLESLDSLTTREISLIRSYRNLSALIKWEISPVYWNRSFVQ